MSQGRYVWEEVCLNAKLFEHRFLGSSVHFEQTVKPQGPESQGSGRGRCLGRAESLHVREPALSPTEQAARSAQSIAHARCLTQCHLSSAAVEDLEPPKAIIALPRSIAVHRRRRETRQRLQGPCICLLVAGKRERQLSVSTIQIRRLKISAVKVFRPWTGSDD